MSLYRLKNGQRTQTTQIRSKIYDQIKGEEKYLLEMLYISSSTGGAVKEWVDLMLLNLTWKLNNRFPLPREEYTEKIIQDVIFA
jgi:hypothetical protein